MSNYYCLNITSNHTIDLNDGYYVYFADANSNNINIYLPDISSYDGIPILFVRTDTNISYNVILNAYSGQNIDGNSTKSISITDKSFELISFSQNWISHK